MSEVYTLVMEVSKAPDDDLPAEATGAAFVLLTPANDEDEAVREAVKLFRQAGLHPLEVTNYGTVKERQKDGYEFSEDEEALIEEAREKDAIIILDKQVFFGDDDSGGRN